MIFTLPNIITSLRIPLAFVFLYENTGFRLIALILAMLSDGLDGYLARRQNQISRFGTFLDPFADKFFVFFILAIFLKEHKIMPYEAVTMLCRDFSVMLFGIYLAFRGTLGKYQFRAILCGKLMTALQFAVLICLTCNVAISPFVYVLFILIGLCALIELYLERKKLRIDV